MFRAGGDDFDNPVRCPVGAAVIQFAFIAYDGDIGFHIVSVVFVKEDRKGGSVNFSFSVFGINIISNMHC